jgi:hypothetical protein
MKPTHDINDLIEYKAQIVEQKKALKNSTAFTELEIFNLENCYEYQIAICNAKIKEHKMLFPIANINLLAQV